MKLRLPPLYLTTLVLLLSCTPGVKADFDLYQGFVNIVGGSNQHYYADHWYVFGGEPSCDDAWGANTYGDSDDVSGSKTGVRCRGGGCWGNTDPANIDLVEMHFSNNPLYHFSKS